MRQKTIYFANFINHYGAKGCLLDYANEIVIPAFVDDALVKQTSSTSFYFHETKVEKTNIEGRTIPFIAGRFIKDTNLKRDQIFDPNVGLIKDEKTLRSCPSAFFALTLHNHRMAYIPETRFAPSLSEFKSTTLHFLKKKHKQMIDELQENAHLNNQRVTKKDLRIQHPIPSLEVVPITSQDSLDQFLKKYKLLQSINIKLIKPNQELDTQDILTSVSEQYGTLLGANNTKLESTNPKGLNLPNAINKVKEAAQSDNRDIILKGVDEHGNTLKGNNKNFQFEKPIDTLPQERERISSLLVESVKEHIPRKTSWFQQSVIDKIQKIITRL